MSFFNQMGGAGGASPMLGGGGQSSGLMGPGGGMNPQLMQLLMAMQNRQGQPPMPGAAPQMPGAPQAMMPQMQAQPPAQGAPQGLMALLAQMNPQMLQRLLSGGGGAGV